MVGAMVLRRMSWMRTGQRRPDAGPRTGVVFGPITVPTMITVLFLAAAMAVVAAPLGFAGEARAAAFGEASKPPDRAALIRSVHELRSAAAGEPVSIWHIPHPDDETIGMAGAIAAEAADGRRNIVVFYTNGEASDVRHVLNGLVYCTLHGRFHSPHEEGYAPLDKAAFGRARLDEAVAAVTLLGVAAEDVVAVGLPDGGVTVDAALAVMRTLDRLFPGAAHRTTALNDPHPDHRALARALHLFRDEKRAEEDNPPDVRFMSVYAYHRPTQRRGLSLDPSPVRHPALKAAAVAEFAVWEPHFGRFAIGMHSVPRLLTEAGADRLEYVEPLPEVPTIRHRLRRDVDWVLYQDKTAIHVQLDRRMRLRLGVTFAGDVRPPTILFEAPTVFNALTLRIGVSSTDWRLSGVRWSLAGLQVFNRLLLEYEPKGPSPNDGSLRIGWKFAL